MNSNSLIDVALMAIRYAVLALLASLLVVETPALGSDESAIVKALRLSDDLSRYESAFVKATTDLVASGRCALADIEENGGWVKSTTTYRNEPVYFVYCGGLTVANRIYLNAETGSIFK